VCLPPVFLKALAITSENGHLANAVDADRSHRNLSVASYYASCGSASPCTARSGDSPTSRRVALELNWSASYAKRTSADSLPDQLSGEFIIISGSLGMFSKEAEKKPAHMFELPGPWIISLPSLLDGRLYGSGLP
jgi:hypothetical protein